MPRIHTVAQDGIITAGDKLIGSDGDPNNGYVTRNYTVGGISNFVLGGTNAGSFTTITTTGNGTIGGNLSVTGDLSVTGNATIAGNLTFGDADTDTVSFSADVNSHILPDVTNTYDLGSSTKQWRDIYVDGTAYIDHMDLLEVGPHVTIGQGSYPVYANNSVLSSTQKDYGLSIVADADSNGYAFVSLNLGTKNNVDGAQISYNKDAYPTFRIGMGGTTYMEILASTGSTTFKRNLSVSNGYNFSAGYQGQVYIENVNVGASGSRYTLVNARPSSDNQFLKYTTNGVTEWNDPITPITDVATFNTLNIQDPMTLSQRSYHRIILGNSTLVNSQQKAGRISSYTHIDLQADADNNGLTGTQQSNPVTGGDLRFLSYNTLRFLVNGDSGKIYINPKDSNSLILPSARGTEGHYLKQGANGQAEWAAVTSDSIVGDGTNTVHSAADDFVVNLNLTNGGMTIVTQDGTNAGNGPEFRLATNSTQNAFILDYDDSIDEVRMQRHGGYFLRAKANEIELGNKVRIGTADQTANSSGDGLMVNEGQQSGMTIMNSGTTSGFSRLYFGKSDNDDAYYIGYTNSSEQLEIRKDGNLIVAINTNGPSNAVMVDIGYLLKLGNVSTFADDTAAGAGGLTTGMVYKKSDGTLMIKS